MAHALVVCELPPPERRQRKRQVHVCLHVLGGLGVRLQSAGWGVFTYQELVCSWYMDGMEHMRALVANGHGWGWV